MPLCSRTHALELLTPHTSIQPTHATLAQDVQDEFAVFRCCTDSHTTNCLKIGEYEDVGCLAEHAILAETCFLEEETIQDTNDCQQGILMHEYLLDDNVLIRRSTPVVILQRGKSRGVNFLRVQCKHTTNATFWCREVDVVVIPPGWTCHVLPYCMCDCIINPTHTRHVECHVFLPKKEEMVRVYVSTRKKARPNGSIQDLVYDRRDDGINFHWQEDTCSDSAITGCIVLLRLDANT